MYIPLDPGFFVRELRQNCYYILKQFYPTKLSASEIAFELNRQQIGPEVTASQVTYAIRYYSLRCKHFAVFPIGGIKYSVYPIDPPFTAWVD